MTGNKSYWEIAKSCKCTGYVDDGYTSFELWSDSIRTYKCIWLPQNKGELPTTIEILNEPTN